MTTGQAALLLRQFMHAKRQKKWQLARDLIILLSHEIPNGSDITYASDQPSTTDGLMPEWDGE